ncbi:hypothetical protein CBR_g38272 [Chara braunii]|uniref:DUF659 domain-containing protein n=1 Tax=Chara braunii TaxID=69332 RepID=A0A388LQ21_CHABU|nr:hypothetical protein CBR_g38272 [Chara braunii]|eukprot:GBG84302.1 hypothetical protein CBR_g38272 [Chara braunii]
MGSTGSGADYAPEHSQLQSHGQWDHFLKKGKPSTYRSGEMLHLLARRGVKIQGDATKTMLHQDGVEKGIPEDRGIEPSPNADKSTVDNIEQHLRPPPAPGREVWRTEVDVVPDTREEEAITAVAPSCVGSSLAAEQGKTTQTSIRRWTENNLKAQKRLDMQWGRTLFRFGVPFNFVHVDETQALHDSYTELGTAKAKVDMPSFDTLRTVILDVVHNEVKPSTSGMFQAALSSRMARQIASGGLKTSAAVIAKLREEVIREIGVHTVNAICTDNAGVNKGAAMILSRSVDPNIAKIPWVPCTAHTLSLLLKDVSKLSWVSKIVKRTKMMAKFTKDHHRTVALFSECSFEEKKTLGVPTDVSFAKDVECWTKEPQRCAGAGGSLDEADRAAAKDMADRDHDLMQRRIREEVARRETVPLRSRLGAQLPRPTTSGQQQQPVEQHPDHMANQQWNELEQHDEHHHLPIEQQHFLVDHQQFPIDQQSGQQKQEELAAEHRLCNEEEQKLPDDQQHLSHSQQQAAGQEPQQYLPSFPHLDETLVHDNINISRAGRKWKNVFDPTAAPMVKHGRGRPRKGEANTVQLPPLPPAARPKRTKTGKATSLRRWKVVEATFVEALTV